MEQSSFTGAELAARARVGQELVDRLVELGVLAPAGGETAYGLGDVRRVRLADACRQAGLSLEGIGEAIAAGRLSFAFLDLVSLAGRPLAGTTYEQLCAELELPMARLHPPHRGARRPGGGGARDQPGRPGRAGVAPPRRPAGQVARRRGHVPFPPARPGGGGGPGDGRADPRGLPEAHVGLHADPVPLHRATRAGAGAG